MTLAISAAPLAGSKLETPNGAGSESDRRRECGEFEVARLLVAIQNEPTLRSSDTVARIMEAVERFSPGLHPQTTRR
jgi:hypothetical protein